jgi:hypothetical protein
LAKDFIVPKAQNAVALSLQPSRADQVGGGVPLEPMLRAIDLDHELDAVTDEIHDVRAERSLPPEVRARNRNAVEMPPEPLFGRGHGAPKRAGAGGAGFSGTRHGVWA